MFRILAFSFTNQDSDTDVAVNFAMSCLHPPLTKLALTPT